MKYDSYPDVRNEHPELKGNELIIASSLKLIENIQRDQWGSPINDGNILKPVDPNLILNWIGGGIYQYKTSKSIISSTYALSLPEDNPYIDERGMKYSGLGCEYFIETHVKADWAIAMLINIASYIYRKDSMILHEGMFIPSKSGYIPLGRNPNNIGILCVKNHEVEMPDGKCDYLKLVPLTESQTNDYIQIGDEKAKMATDWYKKLNNNDVFMI
jgi:Suppressor of fused protein (SUFU)